MRLVMLVARSLVVSCLTAPVAAAAQPVVSYVGGKGHDGAKAVAVDAQGDVVVVGVTQSPEAFGSKLHFFGPRSNRPMAFVARFDHSGKVLWASFFDGAPNDVALDGASSVYVTGNSLPVSPALPVSEQAVQPTAPGFGDAFVVKLSRDGSSLAYATYFGGGRDDRAIAIAVDAKGSAYVAGTTESSDLPITPGALRKTGYASGDAFVMKLNPSGTAYEYVTYIGGTGWNAAADIAVDGPGNAYVVGSTRSKDFPVNRCPASRRHSGETDAFFAKLDRTGSQLLIAGWLGGSAQDHASAVALGPDDTFYVAGSTSSPDFPTTRGAFQTSPSGASDGFVARLHGSGTGLVWSTYVGGEQRDVVDRMTVDGHGSAWLAGVTDSRLLIPGGSKAGGETNSDAFVFRLDVTGENPVGSRFGAYFGGSKDELDIGIGVGPHAFWLVGTTHSADLRTTPSAAQPLFGGLADAFVVSRDSDPVRTKASPLSPAPPVGDRCPDATPPLRIGMSGQYMPLHGYDAGAAIGFEADLAREIGNVLGREVQFLDRQALKGTTLEAVAAGAADAALSAITPTAERRKKVDFTAPYLRLKVRIAAPAGTTPPASFAGKRVALVDGPWRAEARRKLRGAKVRLLKTPAQAFALLDSGAVDLVAGEDVGLVAAAGPAGLTFAPQVLGSSPIAVAVPKGGAVAFDEALRKLGPKIAELERRWNVGEPRPPPASDALFVAICEKESVLPLVSYRGGEATPLLDIDRGTIASEDISAELAAAAWYQVSAARTTPLRGSRCAEGGVLVSRPATAGAPAGREGVWARVSNTLWATARKKDWVETCKYTDSEGTYECGERGYEVVLSDSGRETTHALITERFGD